MTTSVNAFAAADRVRAGWDRLAPMFDRHTAPLTMQLGEHVLDRVGVHDGMRLLDVAAGSGALALPAARRGADVVATDIAPVMIERLRTRARAAGMTNLEARVMDGYALDLDADTFDVVASQNGVSLFPDLQRGLREMVRVARPGGRVVVVAFGPLRAAEFLMVFMAALKASVPGFAGLPADPPPLPFQVSDPAVLKRELEAAGLSRVHVTATDWAMAFRSGSHFLAAVTPSNPIAAELTARLTPAQRRDVSDVLDAMFRERFEGGTAVLHNAVNIGVGTK